MGKYLILGAVILFAIMSGVIFILKKENANLLQKQGTLTAQIEELKRDVSSRDEAIKLCSDNTRKLKAESDKRAEAAAKAQEEARQVGKSNRELADELLKFKRKPNETECDAAKRVFDEYLDKRK